MGQADHDTCGPQEAVSNQDVLSQATDEAVPRLARLRQGGHWTMSKGYRVEPSDSRCRAAWRQTVGRYLPTVCCMLAWATAGHR